MTSRKLIICLLASMLMRRPLLAVVFINFSNYLLYTTAEENAVGSGEFTFAAVAEKIMQQTGIRGIVVDNQIKNVFWKILEPCVQS